MLIACVLLHALNPKLELTKATRLLFDEMELKGLGKRLISSGAWISEQLKIKPGKHSGALKKEMQEFQMMNPRATEADCATFLAENRENLLAKHV